MVAGEENDNKGEFSWVGNPRWLPYQLQNRMLGLNFIDTRLVDCLSHAEGVSRWVHLLPPRHDSVGIFFPIQALGTKVGGSGTCQWRLCLDLIGMS